jgi:hypothetical protein
MGVSIVTVLVKVVLEMFHLVVHAPEPPLEVHHGPVQVGKIAPLFLPEGTRTR